MLEAPVGVAGAVEECPADPVGLDDVVSLGEIVVIGAIVVVPIVLFGVNE